MPTAYSYVRFSSSRQEMGDSLRRQVALSVAFAGANGLTLDESLSLRDLGISAFDHRNVESGALGAFLHAVRSGQVAPGSYLLVESLDRISRAQVRAALNVFMEIINAGITIVTLNDNQSYSSESIDKNWTQLIISMAVMSRAHEESLTKAKRIQASWESKRKRADIEKLTRRCPSWMEASADRSKFVLKPQATRIVRMIVSWSMEGLGQTGIAKRLNSRGIQNISGTDKGWHSSYIAKILSSTALYGEARFEKRTGVSSAFQLREPISNYYPAIIDKQQWLELQRLRKGRRTGGGPVRKNQVTNLFAGLLRCGYCKGSMTLGGYSRRDPIKVKKYVVCSTAKRGLGCHFLQWGLPDMEVLALRFLREVDVSEVLAAKSLDRTPPLSGRESLQLQIDETESRISNLLQAIEVGGDTPTLVKRLAELERAVSELRKSLSVMEETLASDLEISTHLASHQQALEQLASFMETANSEARTAVRRRLAEHIRKIVKEIEVFAGGGDIEPQFGAEGRFLGHRLSTIKKEERTLTIYFRVGNYARQVFEKSRIGRPVSVDLEVPNDL